MSGPNILSSGEINSRPASSEEDLFQALATNRVVMDCPDHIRTYLGRYPELIPHVVAAVERSRQQFGEQAELTLTINDDPECYDPYLKMYVSLPRYGPDTRVQLDAIQGLLDEATADLDGFFLVTTDYRQLGN